MCPAVVKVSVAARAEDRGATPTLWRLLRLILIDDRRGCSCNGELRRRRDGSESLFRVIKKT